jgi:ATP-dependent Clp protease ATP-binding subunit ClpA
MARLSIALPDYIAEKLDEEAKRLDVAHSTLIAHLKWVEKLIAEHEAEMQQVRDAYEEQVQQIKADSAARTQHVEEELQRLETLTRRQPPTAEPEPQPTAEPSPSVPPVSDTDVRSSRPRGDTLNVPTDVELSPIEPSPEVAVTKDTKIPTCA